MKFYILFSEEKIQLMVVSLSILDYDVSKSSARYRGLVNDDQVVVVHLQSVDTKDSPLSQLSLCPGVPETDVVLSSPSVTKFFIEKVEDEIICRSGEFSPFCLMVD